ncbi:MAG: peptidoglycan-binding domain-containing protein [Pirellulales bacterium]
MGSNGSQVSTLQKALSSLGYFTYPAITGYFGPITEQAVEAFQSANNLAVVGIVGSLTRPLLGRLGW